MRFRFVLGIASAAASIVFAVAAVSAASPTTHGQIALAPGANGGLAFSSEQITASGAVIDTFSSTAATLRVIGTPGSSVAFNQSTDSKTSSTTATVDLIAAARPKTAADQNRYAASGRSTVKDLIALGMPADEARAQFGDMDVMDSAPATSSLTGQIASAAGNRPPAPAQLAVSTTTPWDTQCASLSYASGKITGYGCSTLYLVAASGSDWWFNSKYKLSAHSTDTSFLYPLRLAQVGWGLHWATNNVVYDWDPAGVINRSSCSSLSIIGSYHGFSISISAPVCPTKIDAWNLSSLSSGSVWTGLESGNDYEAAIGTQGDHNPPTASTTHDSPFTLTWGPWG